MNHSQIAQIRLNRQRLIASKLQTPGEVVAWMGAMQAQDYNMAKWAVGIRIPGSTDKQVQEAFDKGEIIRTHVMRPTWHLVTPEDIRWMLPLTASRILSSMKSRDQQLGITADLYHKAYRILEKILEGNKQLTREEISNAFEMNKLLVDTSQLYHLMLGAEGCGIVCSGAMKGKQHTYALLEERIPPAAPLTKEEALAKLAQKYFRSHGPATLDDFVWWSGLSVTEARRGLEMVQKDLTSISSDTQVYWVDQPVAEESLVDIPTHLLPAFDEYIIAYRDRKPVLPSEDYSKAVSSNGIFRPVVLHHGQAAGIWKKAARKNNPIECAFFEKGDRPNAGDLEKATAVFQSYLR